MDRCGKLVVITGPSGVGKSTIVREVLRRTGATFSVSATTRSPRPGEQDGREYRFVDRPTFQAMIDAGELLEWADVFGQYYGTPAEPVREAVAAGQTVIVEIDVQGGEQVHAAMPEATFVLIEPPSMAALTERLGGRGTEDADSLHRRLSAAGEEIAAAKAGGVYNYCIVNDDLNEAIDAVVEVVQAETTEA